jgi:hypothetical protein
LLHLTEPHRALLEMHGLLAHDGILVCEDGDLTSAVSLRRRSMPLPVCSAASGPFAEWTTRSAASSSRWCSPPALPSRR